LSTPATLLVIDDNENGRKALVGVLSDYGHRVLEADGGEAGLIAIRREKPDLVLLDLMMPGTDGFQVLRELRRAEDAVVAKTPVLVITRNQYPQEQVRALEQGADDFVTVPDANNEVIATRVATLLQRAVRAPFHDGAGDTLLSLTCGPQQPVHILRARNVDYVGITKDPLQIDINAWAALAQATATATSWRTLAKDLGKRLWATIFGAHMDLQGAYLDAARSTPAKLRLRFPGRAELLGLPLEFMQNEGAGGKEAYLTLIHPFSRSVVGLRRNTPALGPELLNRIWAQRQSAKGNGTREHVLRVLAIASNVSGPGLPAIPNVDLEVQALANQLPGWFARRGIEVTVDVLPTRQATSSEVRRMLELREHHVIHYAGHAVPNLVGERFGLPFWSQENCSGGVEWLNPLDLQTLLSDSSVAFVYLSACHGMDLAHPGQLVTHDFLGFVDAVTGAGVPAMLGFRWPVSDEAALKFATKVYESLSRQGELDVAVLDARQAVHNSSPEDSAWLSPVLVVQP